MKLRRLWTIQANSTVMLMWSELVMYLQGAKGYASVVSESERLEASKRKLQTNYMMHDLGKARMLIMCLLSCFSPMAHHCCSLSCTSGRQLYVVVSPHSLFLRLFCHCNTSKMNAHIQFLAALS